MYLPKNNSFWKNIINQSNFKVRTECVSRFEFWKSKLRKGTLYTMQKLFVEFILKEVYFLVCFASLPLNMFLFLPLYLYQIAVPGHVFWLLSVVLCLFFHVCCLVCLVPCLLSLVSCSLSIVPGLFCPLRCVLIYSNLR